MYPKSSGTPQSLYNTVTGTKSKNCYLNSHVTSKYKMYRLYRKNDHKLSFFLYNLYISDPTQMYRYITKTCLYNFDPLKPHFYIVKLGFTGVYIIFLISAQKLDSGYTLEPPHRGGSNEYPQSMF